MADTTTVNFGFTLIQVGASRDTWGTKLNANWSALDTALDAARDTANAALPKAGGAITGAVSIDAELTRLGQGVVPHWSASGLNHGSMFLSPSAGSDPTSQPGDIWFGYTP